MRSPSRGSRRRLPELGLTALALSCTSTADPVGPRPSDSSTGLALEVLTDKPRYFASIDSRVEVHLTNVGSVPVYTSAPSYFLRLDRWTGTAWQDAGVWYLLLAITPSLLTIAPGDSSRSFLELVSPVISTPGRYRFRYDLYEDPQLKNVLPLTFRVSNPFEVIRDSARIPPDGGGA